MAAETRSSGVSLNDQASLRSSVSFSAGKRTSRGGWVLFAAAFIVSGCGGGGSGPAAPVQPPNSPPAIDAGANQQVYSGQSVVLRGTASDADGTVQSVAWTQAGGPLVSLTGNGTLTAGFAAPDVTTNSTITLVLTVADNAGGQSQDQVVVTVLPRGRTPLASAGSDQTQLVGATITLDGSGSTDPEGDVLTYEWAIVSAPALSSAVLSATASAQPAFVPDVPGRYELRLVVKDYANSSAPDTALITAGTELAGIITGNVTLSVAASPYLMTADVQIPYLSSLIIPAGVELIGANHLVRVGGVLRAEGTAAQQVVIMDAHIEPATGPPSSPYSIELAHVHVVGGSIYRPTGFAIYGRLTLSDSRIEDTSPGSYMYVWYPVAESRIERNVFVRTGGISTGHLDADVLVRNNVFVDQTPTSAGEFAVQNWASYGTSRTIVTGNSFLSTDRVALRLPAGYANAALDGASNYWGTTDPALIERMIFDSNDDISAGGEINYLPILAVADPATPMP